MPSTDSAGYAANAPGTHLLSDPHLYSGGHMDLAVMHQMGVQVGLSENTASNESAINPATGEPRLPDVQDAKARGNANAQAAVAADTILQTAAQPATDTTVVQDTAGNDSLCGSQSGAIPDWAQTPTLSCSKRLLKMRQKSCRLLLLPNTARVRATSSTCLWS
jgi:hypothetical protein